MKAAEGAVNLTAYVAIAEVGGEWKRRDGDGDGEVHRLAEALRR